MIDKLDDTEVHCTGSCPTLIIHNQDSPGMVSEVTGILSRKNVNIATLQLYRDKRGGLCSNGDRDRSDGSSGNSLHAGEVGRY